MYDPEWNIGRDLSIQTHTETERRRGPYLGHQHPRGWSSPGPSTTSSISYQHQPRAPKFHFDNLRGFLRVYDWRCPQRTGLPRDSILPDRSAPPLAHPSTSTPFPFLHRHSVFLRTTSVDPSVRASKRRIVVSRTDSPDNSLSRRSGSAIVRAEKRN